MIKSDILLPFESKISFLAKNSKLFKLKKLITKVKWEIVA